jgi:hypothetical protein
VTDPTPPSPRLFADLLSATALAEPDGPQYRAYPALKSARWLLPAAPPYQRAGIAAYRPMRWSGQILKVLIASGLLRGEPAPGATAPLQRLQRLVGARIGAPDCVVSLMIGSPGAYQKYTLRIMDRAGRPIGYAKLADRAETAGKLAAEEAALARLASIPSLQGLVPRTLFVGALNDCRMIATTAGPEQAGPRMFSRSHLDFLRRLHEASRVEKPLLAADLWTAVCATLDWLATRAPGQWRERLAAARQLIEARFHARAMPVSIVHRDFAPWNTCSLSGKLFVFDWEDSVAQGPPLHDVFHFQAIQDALAGRPFNLDTSFAVRVATDLGGTITGEDAEGLFLCYLVDLSSYHLRAAITCPDVGNRTVLKWLEREVDVRLARLGGVYNSR